MRMEIVRKLCSTVLSPDEESEKVTKGSDSVREESGKVVGSGVYMRMEMSLFIFVKTSILIIYPYN